MNTFTWVPAENKLRLWAHFERAGRMWVWMARSWREGEFVWMQQECSPGVAFVRAYLSAKPPKQLGLKGFQRLRFVWVSSWRLPQCSMGESGPGQRSPPLPILPLGNAHCVHQKLDIWSGLSEIASFWWSGYVNGRFWLLLQSDILRECARWQKCKLNLETPFSNNSRTYW